MNSQIVSIVIMTVLAMSVYGVSATFELPALCQPNVLQEMPPNIKKICYALENSEQFRNALVTYLEKQGPSAMMYRPEDLMNGAQADGAFGKRTDVDHVFLRFGRSNR